MTRREDSAPTSRELIEFIASVRDLVVRFTALESRAAGIELDVFSLKSNSDNAVKERSKIMETLDRLEELVNPIVQARLQRKNMWGTLLIVSGAVMWLVQFAYYGGHLVHGN